MDTHATEQQTRQQYAEELCQRYRDLRRWAVEHWPNPAQPLIAADFIATDRELQLLLGARLHVEYQDGSPPAPSDYEQVTPMPWP